jgi:hypothetical protein
MVKILGNPNEDVISMYPELRPPTLEERYFKQVATFLQHCQIEMISNVSLVVFSR